MCCSRKSTGRLPSSAWQASRILFRGVLLPHDVSHMTWPTVNPDLALLPCNLASCFAEALFPQLSVIYTLPRLFPASFTLLVPYFATGTTEKMHEEGQVSQAKGSPAFVWLLRRII